MTHDRNAPDGTGLPALLYGMIVYIPTAIPFEERDLIAMLGRSYTDYRKRVPCLIPRTVHSRKSVKENAE